MKPYLKYPSFALAAVVAGFQLKPVDRANPPVVHDFDGPAEVEEIFRRSCYDCHSNEVSWPWYGYLAPVSWLLEKDVREGRAELNFSDWKKAMEKSDTLDEIYEEMEEGSMPLPIYLRTHPTAKITDKEMAVIEAWLESVYQ